ncbi:MAG: hypothetical protein RLZZ584_3005 [Pseudomonadota bacterium]|jgi:anti-sigma factor RsiW
MNDSPTDPAQAAAVAVEELHAFVDGQLPGARVPAVLAWLQAHPDDARRVLQWQAQALQLRQLAASVVLDKRGDAMAAAVLRAARQAPQRRGWGQAAAVFLLLGLGAAGGRYLPGLAGPAGDAPVPGLAAARSPAFVREAALAHAVFVPEKRHSVEVAASDEAHLVQWLSHRLGAPLKVPSLVDSGYHLLGGRLLPGEGSPRAQFMYENARAERLTLYVAVFAPGQGPGETAFRAARVDGQSTFYWVDDRYGYALSADAGGPDLAAVARAVHAQLEHQAGP